MKIPIHLNYIIKNRRDIYGLIIFTVFSYIFVINIISLIFPVAGKIGTLLWFFSYIFFIIFSLASLYYSIREVFTEKLFITLLILLIWMFIIVSNINKVKNLSFEATQQIGHALYLLDYTKDMAFNKKCFLGYPARQFFLPSLPTLINGRKIISINSGGSLYVLMGLLIFSRSISTNFKDRRYGDLAGGLILSLIFHIYYVNFQIFWFEQSIYPFGLTLIICGLYLYYIKNPSLIYLSMIGLSIFYLIYSYTPALSMACLSITVLIYHYIKEFKKSDRNRKILTAIIIIFCITSFFLSFYCRSDVKLFDKNRPFPVKEIALKVNALLKTDINLIASPFSIFIFSFIIISSLFFVFQWEMFILVIWIMATFIVSITSCGYAVPPPHLAIHRAIIVYPVILLMLLNIIKSVNLEFKRKYYGGLVLVIFLLITGLLYQNDYVSKKTMDNNRTAQLILIKWMRENIPGEDLNKKNITTYFDETLREEPYKSTYDIMMYFWPANTLLFTDSRSDLSKQIISFRTNFLLVPSGGLKKDCYINIKNRLKYLNSFCGHVAIDLYKIE